METDLRKLVDGILSQCGFAPVTDYNWNQRDGIKELVLAGLAENYAVLTGRHPTSLALADISAVFLFGLVYLFLQSTRLTEAEKEMLRNGIDRRAS